MPGSSKPSETNELNSPISGLLKIAASTMPAAALARNANSVQNQYSESGGRPENFARLRNPDWIASPNVIVVTPE